MAVEDLVLVAEDDAAGGHTDEASVKAREELRRHYNALMYRAVLSCTKASLNIIKLRACAKVKNVVGTASTNSMRSRLSDWHTCLRQHVQAYLARMARIEYRVLEHVAREWVRL